MGMQKKHLQDVLTVEFCFVSILGTEHGAKEDSHWNTYPTP